MGAVIYGSSGAAWGAAIVLARAGIRVRVIFPTRAKWGMWPNGLGQTDREQGDVSYRWGALVELCRYFGSVAGVSGELLFPNMQLALAGFDRFIAAEPLVTVTTGAPLEKVTKRIDGRVTSIRCGGVDYPADIFLDASYEGDLLAMAGCMTSIGRMAGAVTGETAAGIRNPAFSRARAFDPRTGERLRGISPAPGGVFGSADLALMAFCLRLIVTDHATRIRWENLPVNPVWDDYLADLNLAISQGYKTIPASIGRELLPIVDGVVTRDANNGGLVRIGTNEIGFHHDWCSLSWAQREERRAAYCRHKAGLFKTIVTDPRWEAACPELVADTRRWGLVPGLFPDEPVPGMSPMMYVRIGRQLVGQDFIDQTDTFLPIANRVSDPMTLVGYPADSHWAWRYAGADGTITMEGGGIRPDDPYETGPYQVPWRAMIPHASLASNLVSVWCLSASTLGFISARIELSGIKIGQAGGIAVAQAIRKGVTTSELDYARDIAPALAAAGAITRGA